MPPDALWALGISPEAKLLLCYLTDHPPQATPATILTHTGLAPEILLYAVQELVIAELAISRLPQAIALAPASCPTQPTPSPSTDLAGLTQFLQDAALIARWPNLMDAWLAAYNRNHPWILTHIRRAHAYVIAANMTIGGRSTVYLTTWLSREARMNPPPIPQIPKPPRDHHPRTFPCKKRPDFIHHTIVAAGRCCYELDIISPQRMAELVALVLPTRRPQ